MSAESVSVRRAGAGDMAGLCRLFFQGVRYHADHAPAHFQIPSQAWAVEFLKKQLGNPDVTVLVAELSGTVVGEARFEVRKSPESGLLRTNTTLQIEEVVVDENHRRRGIAKRLIAGIEEHAARLGIKQVTLNVWGFNTPAERLYAALGYAMQRSVLKKDL